MQPKQRFLAKQLLQTIALAAAVVGQGALGAQIALSQEFEGRTMWVGRAGGFDPRITDPAGDPAVYPPEGSETTHRLAVGFPDPRITDPTGDLTDLVAPTVDSGQSIPNRVVPPVLDPRITDPVGDFDNPGISVES